MGFFDWLRGAYLDGLDSYGAEEIRPDPSPPADPMRAWFDALSVDLQDAALAGFEIARVDTAARAGESTLDTTIDEIRRVRRATLVRLDTHPDANSDPRAATIASTVNRAATAMIERRR
jgi:hypothetical protein